MNKTFMLLILLYSCTKKIETEAGYPCKPFSRTMDHFSWQDSSGTITNMQHTHSTIPDVTLCGKPDIETAMAGPEVRVVKSFDSTMMKLYVDSQIVVLTAKN